MHFQPLLNGIGVADGITRRVEESTVTSAAEARARSHRSFRTVWFLLGLSAALLLVVVSTQSTEVYYASFAAWAMSYAADWGGARR